MDFRDREREENADIKQNETLIILQPQTLMALNVEAESAEICSSEGLLTPGISGQPQSARQLMN